MALFEHPIRNKWGPGAGIGLLFGIKSALEMALAQEVEMCESKWLPAD